MPCQIGQYKLDVGNLKNESSRTPCKSRLGRTFRFKTKDIVSSMKFVYCRLEKFSVKHTCDSWLLTVIFSLSDCWTPNSERNVSTVAAQAEESPTGATTATVCRVYDLMHCNFEAKLISLRIRDENGKLHHVSLILTFHRDRCTRVAPFTY